MVLVEAPRAVSIDSSRQVQRHLLVQMKILKKYITVCTVVDSSCKTGLPWPPPSFSTTLLIGFCQVKPYFIILLFKKLLPYGWS